MSIRIRIIIGFIALALVSGVTPAAAEQVKVIRLHGIISPITMKYLQNGIEEATASGASCLVVQLDTPGGLEVSSHEMVKAILNSPVPVVVFVSPRGARAASAGLFITMAAHVAAMAPNTSIGSAHPVQLMSMPGKDKKDAKKSPGKENDVISAKIVNDLVSTATSIAKTRQRNATWVEKAIRESASLSAEEALKLKVIDLVVSDLDELLTKIDGRTVETNGGPLTLATANAAKDLIELSAIKKFLLAISNPNVAYILLMLGFYGLIHEFANPGIGIAGVAGGICLILALFSLQSIGASLAGLLLLFFGMVLLVLEFFIPSHGILTVGGISAFVLGSFMLIDSPFLAISAGLIISMAVTTLLICSVLIGLVIRAHRLPVKTGLEALLGSQAEARDDITDKDGCVFTRGELWSARTRDNKIAKGSQVTILEHSGGFLWVKAAPDEEAGRIPVKRGKRKPKKGAKK